MQDDDMVWTTKPEFDPPIIPEQQMKALDAYAKPFIDIYGTEANPVALGVKEYKNKVPTHDPYTNPDSHIYYECNCGAILDPGTRSFAQLNNVASAKDWKVRWRKDGQGYEAFCVECGKDKE